MHVRAICSINMAADCAFSLIGVLSMIGSLHPAMTATLLAVAIEIADFNTLAGPVLPVDGDVVFLHNHSPDGWHGRGGFSPMPLMPWLRVYRNLPIDTVVSVMP